MQDTNNMLEEYLEDVRDNMISDELEKRIGWLEDDLRNRLNDSQLCSRFTSDKDADIQYILNVLKSFRLVKEYFKPM